MTYVTCPTTMPTSTLAWSTSFRLSFLKSKISQSQSHKNDEKSNRGLKVRCKMNQSDELDRRNVLIGLGGLYTASNFPQPALSDPVQAPDLSKCGNATITEGNYINCCPPVVDKIVDFKFPKPGKLRVRPASHLVNATYVQKFENAVQALKNLPNDDPHSYYQQANIHCAYCNGAYDQIGFPDLELQIHNSWLFFPWHRWYLYFFERILAKQINDPSFAMPFWNWDDTASMTIPAIYANSKSPLYDTKRNALHLRPTLMDLNYATDQTNTDEEIKSNNLALMYTQMISNAKKPDLFLGLPYRAGDQTTQTGPGSLENSPHIPVHIWTGDPTQPNKENMGNFYSAARDPIFMAHHSNIDRLWTVWSTLKLPGHQNFTDPDWLDTNFLFYDENKQLVKVKVRDCLDETKLGYTNQAVRNQWLGSRPQPRKTRPTTPQTKLKAKIPRTILTEITQPIVLNKKAVTIKVSRANKKRSKKEKDETEEVLLIEGIELSTDEFVKFDVVVNDEDDGATFVGANKAEFAGTFASLPHLSNKGKEGKIKTCLRLGISDLLEDLDVEDDDSILVTLVPKSIRTPITISNVKILFQ